MSCSGDNCGNSVGVDDLGASEKEHGLSPHLASVVADSVFGVDFVRVYKDPVIAY